MSESDEEWGVLLHAVLSDKANDMPRLAYADHCDAAGLPARAEFIRVSCELSRIPEFLPVASYLPAAKAELLPKMSRLERGVSESELHMRFWRRASQLAFAADRRRDELLRRRDQLWEYQPWKQTLETYLNRFIILSNTSVERAWIPSVEVNRGFMRAISCNWDDWMNIYAVLHHRPDSPLWCQRTAEPLEIVYLQDLLFVPSIVHRIWPDIQFIAKGNR